MLHKLKKPLCVLMALALTMLLTIPAAGTDTQRIVRVAFPQQKDVTQIEEDGSYSGYTYDYLEKIAQLTGWKIEYVPIEEPTLDESLIKALEMVQTGEVDLIGCMRKTPGLEEQYEYPQNSYGIMYGTIIAREDDTSLNSANFLLKNPLRVGVRASAVQIKENLEDFFQEHGIHYEFVEYERYNELMEAFQKKEVDVVPDIAIGSAKGSKRLATYASTFFYFAATKGDTHLISELDAAIVKLNQTFPSFQSQLAEKYLNNTLGGFYVTDAEVEYIRQKESIKALCVPDCAPFVFLNSKGELCGIAVSIMEDFAKKTGLNVEYVQYKRGEDFTDAFLDGGFDCVLGIPVNSAYNNKIGVITSTPYLKTQQVYFSRHNVSQKSLSESKIAMIRGTDFAEKVDCKEILFYDTTEECINAVVMGKADGGYGNQYCVEYYSQHNFANLAILPLVGETRNMEMSISKAENTAFLSLMNRYIDNMDSSQIYTFHVAANEEHSNNWFKVLMLSDPLKSSLLIAAFAFTVFFAIAMFFFAKRSGKMNRQLQVASNAKSDFLSRVSHDMRTPMNAILSFSSMNLDNGISQEQLITDMKQINRSGQYLLGLINDVLDMSKIENEKMTLRLEPTMPSECIETILSAIQPMMAEKKLHFYLEIDALKAQQTVLCDVMRTKQIFINLLSNAAKFTPEGGTVTFCVTSTALTQESVNYRFTVRDTGIGMSPEFQKHLFEPFSQERSEKTGQLTGTGLGLAIVKQLVDLMGGTITVKSEQNVGTEFVVELENQIAPVGISAQPSYFEPALSLEEILRGKRVLLCEDHPVNAEIAKRLLKKKEMLVEHAENGQVAVTMFQHAPVGYYDAILMDIKMPVMDGLSAAKAIRALKREDAPSIPIIATTANAFGEDVEKSMQSGMDVHLSKPIDPSQLYRTLGEWICKQNKSRRCSPESAHL